MKLNLNGVLERVSSFFSKKDVANRKGLNRIKTIEKYQTDEEYTDSILEDPSTIINSYSSCSYAKLEHRRNVELIRKLDNLVVKKKMFLDPQLSLTKLGSMLGVNRTYMSNTLREKNGFKNYVTLLRLEYFCNLVRELEQKGEIVGGKITKKQITNLVLQSGFSDLRTFKRSVLERDDKWSRTIRERIYSPLQVPEEEQIPQPYHKELS